MSEATITIPAAAVQRFATSVTKAGREDVVRVTVVGDVLRRNQVGTKGAPSQNAVLKALESAIEQQLGANANLRTGWKFANLGNYARVARAFDTLGLSVTERLTELFYGVQNQARDAYQPAISELSDLPADEREQAAITRMESILADTKAAKQAAREQAEAEKQERARAKQNAGGDAAVAADLQAIVQGGKQTPAAFLRSVEELFQAKREQSGWSNAQLTKVATGLRALADTIESVASTPAEPVAAE